MRKATRIVLAWFMLFGLVSITFTQQSDFEIKERFKTMYDGLKRDIDSARTREQIEQIPNRIKGLQSEFVDRSALISGAFYPKTFDNMIDELRDHFAVAQEKTTTIQVQGERIVELEGQLATLGIEIDKLNAERTELLTKLRSSNNSLAEQKDLVRRLSANLVAKDRLVTAMVDSIFLPYGKNMQALSEIEKDALGNKLVKASLVTRIADIANDNVKFLDATKLEAKDYSTLVNQYEQFNNRWNGLRERVKSAMLANAAMTAAKVKKGQQLAPANTNPTEEVDAALADWRKKLDSSFWSSLMNEYTSRNVFVQPFNDAKSFSASIRAYVDSAKTSGMDAKAFVDEIWIQRVDKDWRQALESESMLGKLEYASLDKAVSQLHTERFDWKIIFWLVNVVAIVLVGWWFLTRKPKVASQQPVTAKPNA